MSGGATDPISAGFDLYLGLARSVWELASRASQGGGDPAAQARAFTEALAAMRSDWQPPPPSWMQGWAQSMAGSAPGPGWIGTGPHGPGFPLGEIPALGLTRERQEAARRLAALGARVLERQQALATHWRAFWDDALRALGDEVARRIAAGKPLGSIRGLYDLWVECAEGAWARMAHGPEYLECQARLVNALSAWRIEYRSQMDGALRALDMPTRGELNSLHLRVRRLRDELRRLEKLLAAPRAASPRTPRARTRKARR